MAIWVISNPQTRKSFRPPAGPEYCWLISSEPGAALAGARAAVAAGARQIIAVGGDGTVNEVLNAVANTEVILGIVPTGGANDLARELGLPRQPERAWQVALSGTVRRLDLIQVQGRFLATGGGLGIGSQIGRRVNAWRHRPAGRWLYQLAAGQECRWSERPAHRSRNPLRRPVASASGADPVALGAAAPGGGRSLARRRPA